MRRVAVIALALVSLGLIVAWPARGGDGGEYLVRAYFDNGSFVVKGEEVRVAGATVGTIDSVDVSREDEIASLEDGPTAIPGKAVVVLKITDDGFKDFLQDASCIIRPQSLIGERFVDCTPTQPRAPGSQPPPELERIEDGERGEGQYLLPVENNGKAIDLDLVQNIMRRPYAERFRLIFNELGASVAGRGEDIGEIIDRANPALRQTDRVLAILAAQSRQLADLAANGDAVLEPLAREREAVTGFIHNANVVNEATAEESADLEEGLAKLPRTLVEVRSTMRELRRLGEQGTPLFADLRAIAPDLNLATRKLGPFATAATPALTSLGDALEQTGPLLVQADGLILDLRSLGDEAKPASLALKKALDTLARTNGFKHAANFVYNVSASLNGYDSFGHFLRSNLLVTACVEYQAVALPGCVADWGNEASAAAARLAKLARKAERAKLEAAVPPPKAPESIEELPEIEQPVEPTTPEPPAGEPPPDTGEEPPPDEPVSSAARRRALAGARSGLQLEDTALLLEFLLGGGS